jgi:predicted nucleotidyltransferase
VTDVSVGDPLAVARRLAERLGEIDGVVAVALGGSRARGAADELSDIDFGLYYRRTHPPALAALQALALTSTTATRAD